MQENTQEQPIEQEQENKVNPNKMRVVSLALLDASMRYREGHWREDVVIVEESYKELFTDSLKKELKVNELPATRKKQVEKEVQRLMKEYKKEQKTFGKKVYGYIDGVTARMTKETQIGFDNYATAFGILADNLEKAKNTTHLLTIVQMYNQGVFDELLKTATEKKEEVQP